MHVATQPNLFATTEGNDLMREEGEIMTSIIEAPIGVRDCVNGPFLLGDCVKMKILLRDCVNRRPCVMRVRFFSCA